MAGLLHVWGVTGELIGKTPVIEPEWAGKVLLPGSTRGDEIQAWLNREGASVDHFVILDDEADMAHLQHKLVRTDSATGLTMRNAEQAIAMLSRIVT